jgi:glycosyltransferase involved in cell wall biosynthesis
MNADTTIFVLYNRYLTRGGEDEVFESEVRLLADHGLKVVPVTESTAIPDGVRERLKMGATSIWSRAWHRRLGDLVRRNLPAIVHVHNTFPLMSPSVLYAARRQGAAVVHTLHNYRLICPNALCFRSGRICEDCVGRSIPWPGVVHACHRGSRLQSAGVATTLSTHHLLGTWKRQVDVFVALTEFGKQTLVKGGIPPNKVVVKPNFVADPGNHGGDGNYALFVGRLARNKGIETMIRAWRRSGSLPLKIVGDPTNPQEAAWVTSLSEVLNVEMLGRVSREEIFTLMRGARFLVFPSEWYEGFPLAIVEAFACGLPVIASRLGATAEIVEDGKTGLLFRPGNAADLESKVRWASRNPERLRMMGLAARAQYKSAYTPEVNYEMLIRIYERASSSQHVPIPHESKDLAAK